MHACMYAHAHTSNQALVTSERQGGWRVLRHACPGANPYPWSAWCGCMVPSYPDALRPSMRPAMKPSAIASASQQRVTKLTLVPRMQCFITMKPLWCTEFPVLRISMAQQPQCYRSWRGNEDLGISKCCHGFEASPTNHPSQQPLAWYNGPEFLAHGLFISLDIQQGHADV